MTGLGVPVTPYYDGGDVVLHHGDCRELADVWTSADVLLCDPPYGIDYRSGWHSDSLPRSIGGDRDTAVRDAVLNLWGNRPALVFGTWRIPRPAGTQARLVWDTLGALGMGDLSIPWKPSDQEVYVLGHGDAGRFAGPRTSNVLRFPPVQSMARNGRLHPHEKPVELLSALIAKCPSGALADPCAGSGSLGVAARLHGRRAVLVEADERYCEIAARRLDQGVLDFGAAS